MAPHPLPSFTPGNDRSATLLVPDSQVDTDSSDVDGPRAAIQSREQIAPQQGISDGPVLFHKVKNQRSILSLCVSDGKIFAGTQGGEILVQKLQICPEWRVES